MTIKDKRIAITGTLVFYKRKDAFEQISSRGGIPQRTVTRDTDYLVVGFYREGILNGKKSKKCIIAEKYMTQGKNIKLITGDEFTKALWDSPVLC